MEKVRAHLRLSGIVQGVGIRPFIHRSVEKFSLCGYIKNTSLGVEIEIEGKKADVDDFINNIYIEAPKASIIEKIEIEYMDALAGYTDFEIKKSERFDIKDALISPDLCICENCLDELFDPDNKRYKYPFINCTDCGPRFTIIKDIPYDREKTTMSDFKMCGECQMEYDDINNRRYHAQPDCCFKCGPKVFYHKSKDMAEGDNISPDFIGSAESDEAIMQAAEDIKNGKIIAIKGLGGFHLACRADSKDTVQRLRSLKMRDEKPLAIMTENADDARKLCFLNEDEEKLLISKKRPIVLLEKKDKESFKHISENYHLGIMLPYTPLHYLLFEALKDVTHKEYERHAGTEGAIFDDALKEVFALVMTSANFSDMPILYNNDEAIKQLKGIVDGLLMHNRDIETRCDDSLMWVFNGKEYPARRSRGYVPYPIIVEDTYIEGDESKMFNILSCGAEQKASFALLKGRHIFLSQHIGDMKNAETFDFYKQQIKHFEKLFGIEPEVIACDLHPDYLSCEYAESIGGKRLIKVQHHHAHMAACMADNGISDPCIGIIWDGAGLGRDGSIWGGEFFTGDYHSFERVATIYPFRLPGGDASTREIWRIAVSLIYESMDRFKENERCLEHAKKIFLDKVVENIVKMLDMDINCPVCTSMGRLFDAVSAMLGIKMDATYEGQGAILLETEAIKYIEYAKKRLSKENYCKVLDPLEFKFDYDILEDDIKKIDHRPMIKEIISLMYDFKVGGCTEDKFVDKEHFKGMLALKFMNTLVDMAVQMTKTISEDTGLLNVAISGGVFQNQYLLKKISALLEAEGLQVYHHNRVSTNDEGIAVGQAMVARAYCNK